MAKLGVILGSNATGPWAGPLAAEAEAGGAAVVFRHEGPRGYVPPHLIDHEANFRLLLDAGCDRVLAVCSVGSLRAEIPVGTLLCPDDFIALDSPVTTFDDERGHIAPGFDPAWRARVTGASPAGGEEIRDGGTYWQANGPRFETPAEIRMMAAHAEVVGMTMASECVVAGELGLPYAALCAVDNLANGVGGAGLDLAGLEHDREANAARLRNAIEALVGELG